MSFDHRKYRPFEAPSKPDRRWPDRRVQRAPRWASVDLRDGNQALARPMDPDRKLEFFELLLAIGFKEIEVGFPAASRPDYDFVRRLIEEDRIPDEVHIQVLTQAREDLIARTFEALRGAPRAIVHVYNATSPAHRAQVFRLDRAGVMEIARRGAREIRERAARQTETEWTFQYSPEGFSQTEPEFAVEICAAVNDIWRPDLGQAVIINLPATVEAATPNVFADQVELFCDRLEWRELVSISVHTHNDRGQAVAAAELALLAGANRVEGTLFGNGERTGNMDLVTLAMNLYSQGIDPGLDLSAPQRLLECYTRCTGMPVHPRHPWVGELVYTAFSGSHQDAIRKGLRHYQAHPQAGWQVPYLPIDPDDIGRSSEAVVRITSQSGKSGVAHVLERDHGLEMPAWLARALAAVVQRQAELGGAEVPSAQIHRCFLDHFCAIPAGWRLRDYALSRAGGQVQISFGLHGKTEGVRRRGMGRYTAEAALAALTKGQARRAKIRQFEQRPTQGGHGPAMACVWLDLDGHAVYAAAFAEDAEAAAIQSMLTAMGRGLAASAADTERTAAGVVLGGRAGGGRHIRRAGQGARPRQARRQRRR